MSYKITDRQFYPIGFQCQYIHVGISSVTLILMGGMWKSKGICHIYLAYQRVRRNNIIQKCR